jgi:hypothetical protein
VYTKEYVAQTQTKRKQNNNNNNTTTTTTTTTRQQQETAINKKRHTDVSTIYFINTVDCFSLAISIPFSPKKPFLSFQN